MIRPHDDTSIASGGMLSRIKRRQLLRIGFLTGTLLFLITFVVNLSADLAIRSVRKR